MHFVPFRHEVKRRKGAAMAKIIAVANQKGGVGKTTTVENLGVGLAGKGKKVLLIDCDPQGSLTVGLGWRQQDDLYPALSDVMKEYIGKREETQDGKERQNFLSFLDKAVLHSDEGVDLLPGNIYLATLEQQLYSVLVSRESVLSEIVEMIRDLYDYVLIDCMPSLGMLTVNALIAADSVIIPVQTQFLAVKGLSELLKTVNAAKRINRELTVDGILFTMYDSRTRANRDLIEKVSVSIRSTYGKDISIYQSIIPRSVRQEESPLAGTSIFVHDPKGKVAAAYEKFTEEVLVQ